MYASARHILLQHPIKSIREHLSNPGYISTILALTIDLWEPLWHFLMLSLAKFCVVVELFVLSDVEMFLHSDHSLIIRHMIISCLSQPWMLQLGPINVVWGKFALQIIFLGNLLRILLVLAQFLCSPLLLLQYQITHLQRIAIARR